jgi:hypothetical protein
MYLALTSEALSLITDNPIIIAVIIIIVALVKIISNKKNNTPQ